MKRITKAEARKLFAQGKPVTLCPCKLYPGGPWSIGCRVFGKEWIERADRLYRESDLWKGTAEATGWDLMYNEWKYYNASYETGYYAHYYVEG